MSQDDIPLEALRDSIDDVDTQLLKLLNQRASLAKEIGKLKAKTSPKGAIYYRPERERALIDRLQKANSGPFPGDAVRPVFQEIIGACLRLEETLRVAYLGPEATFTHQAVKRHFGTSAKSIPCGTIDGVFSEVEGQQVSYGVVPVENSAEGVVRHTLDCFVESPLVIVAEVVVPVEHCLLVRDDIDERSIERVYSHPQALAQCRGWLAANLARAALVQTASTADAARAAHDDSAGAAVAGELAARMYGLCVLRRQLQDHSDNVTRFLVIGRQMVPVDLTKDVTTSLLLTLPDRAGALLDVLTQLSGAGINLSKIESRPTRLRAWDYVFFLDLDGHHEDPPIAAALNSVSKMCDMFRVLGSYQKADTHE